MWGLFYHLPILQAHNKMTPPGDALGSGHLCLSFWTAGSPDNISNKIKYFPENTWQRSKNDPTRGRHPAGSFCCVPFYIVIKEVSKQIRSNKGI